LASWKGSFSEHYGRRRRQSASGFSISYKRNRGKNEDEIH
jgi:hypothetical protein